MRGGKSGGAVQNKTQYSCFIPYYKKKYKIFYTRTSASYSAMYIRNYLVKIFKWLSANCAKQLCTSSIFFQLNFPGCCLQYRIFHLSHRQPRCFRASFTLYSLTVIYSPSPLKPQATMYLSTVQM